MHQPAPQEILESHARRPVRAFLRKSDEPASAALWDLVYGQVTDVTHQQAEAIEAELEQSPRKISDILAGWRPTALSAK